MAATSVAVTIKEEPKETGVQLGQVSLKYSLNSHLLLSVTLSVFVFKSLGTDADTLKIGTLKL